MYDPWITPNFELLVLSQPIALHVSGIPSPFTKCKFKAGIFLHITSQDSSSSPFRTATKTMAAATCSALVIKGTKDSGLGLIQDLIRVPKPGGQQYLVKVSHVAQNPTDGKSTIRMLPLKTSRWPDSNPSLVQAFDSGVFGEGSILGCDFVGTVEDIGSSTESDAKGVTIAGLVWGGEVKGLGALSQYTLADSKISFPVPESITPEQAATIPLASATAELALFSRHCLSIDKSAAGTPVLIWGGSCTFCPAYDSSLST